MNPVKKFMISPGSSFSFRLLLSAQDGARTRKGRLPGPAGNSEPHEETLCPARFSCAATVHCDLLPPTVGSEDCQSKAHCVVGTREEGGILTHEDPLTRFIVLG